MASTHILSQFIWPDGAPTGLYAEQLAARLASRNRRVALVGGSGEYRAEDRPRPPVEIVSLAHWRGSRKRLSNVFLEYLSVERALRSYIGERVQRGDQVVVTSAPPNSVRLAGAIHARGAAAIYWLQDYYPELVRGIVHPPALVRAFLTRWFDRHLSSWDRVVKCGANLGYRGLNARVIRNWPTLSFDSSAQAVPKTALYSGNLGYGHDVHAFIASCEELRQQGYQITVRGDGPGLASLPGWIDQRPPLREMKDLARSYLEAEVHLVAAHPQIQHAIFPSKLWNSLAAGRRIVYSGFSGAMSKELEESLASPWPSHLDQWETLLADVERT